MDPELMNVEEMKAFGLWPNDRHISVAMVPYVNRIRQDKLAALLVGDLHGESTYDFLSRCPKLVRVNVVNTYTDQQEMLKTVFKRNTDSFKGKIQSGIEKNKTRDIVCIDVSACTPDNLELYYHNVKSGGIFCGNAYDTEGVKIALTAFRRKMKIGTPIQICHNNIWFWYAR